mmetsp:Transcript_32873/g.57414  ORF Transcript_32873/g.57414 Transcript_32873/m.57414 type:complete len:606 (-) Transcript_32873:2545-4362(-)
MIRNMHDEARITWLEAFCEVVRNASPDAVSEHCERPCLAIGEFSNSISSRETGAHMLGAIAEVMQNDISPDLYHRIFKLAQDPRCEVRRAMSQAFKHIIPALSDPSLKPQLIEEALKLVRDEVVEVKIEAFTMLTQILDNFPYDVNVNQVVPIIEAELLHSDDPYLLKHTSHIIGLLVSKLEAELSEEPFRTNLIDFIVKLSFNKDPSVRASLSKAFPLLIQTFGQMTFYSQLAPAFVRILEDTCYEVADAATEVFYEVLKILGNSQILKPSFLFMLNRVTVSALFLKQLPDIVKTFNDADIKSEVSLKLTSMLEERLSWRMKNYTLHCIKLLVNDLDPQVFPKLSTTLLELIHTAARPIALPALELVCYIMRKSPRALRLETLDKLYTLLEASNFKHRMLFLDFCEFFGRTHSRQLFKENLIILVLSMVRDPVVDVRFKLAKCFPTFRQFISNDDTETSTNFMQTLDELLNDSSPAVARCAGESHSAFMNRNFWKKINSEEEERIDKQKRYEELEQERRERISEEEEKKRVVEKLAQKAKMDFLSSKEKRLSGTLKRQSTKTLPAIEKPKIRSDRRRVSEAATSGFKASTPRPLAKSLTLPKLP